MMPAILSDGFETAVRSKMGVKESELPSSDINQPIIVDLAEAVVMDRVPDYDQVVGKDRIFLQNAVISYICFLLSPSMSRRLNINVSTIDVRWEKEKVDWEKKAESFLSDYEASLVQITSVVVGSVVDADVFAIIPGVRGGEDTQV